MVGEQVKAFKVGSVQWSIVLQLFCCHCLILAVAVIYGVPVLPVIPACLLSFLLLLNIPYNLHVLEMALERLSKGIAVEPLSLRLRWPLARLFVLVNALGQQTGKQEQREQRNVAYRDQLVRQVSKTAAQEERNRLARDLHDSIKQQIYSIVVNAAAVKVRWEHNSAGARKAIDDIERTANAYLVVVGAAVSLTDCPGFWAKTPTVCCVTGEKLRSTRRHITALYTISELFPGFPLLFTCCRHYLVRVSFLCRFRCRYSCDICTISPL